MNLFADCLSSPVITLALQLVALSLLGLAGTFLARRQSAMRRKTIAFGAIAAIGLIIPFFLIFQLTGSGIFRPDAGNMQPLPPTAPVRPAPPANQTEAAESDGSGADTAGSASSQPHVRLSGRRLSQAILSLWGIGTLAGLLYLLHGLLFLRWFRVGLEPLTEPKFNRLLRRSAETLQLRRRLTLFCSPIVDSPITIGFRQPTIIIPAKLVNHLSDDEMQSILLHELAHVRQGDPLTGLLVRIIAAFCWWNPLLHHLLQVHSQSCEEVADNYVLTVLSPQVYSSSLLKLAEKTCLISNCPAAIGMAGRRSNLSLRIKNILTQRRFPMTTSRKMQMFVAIVAVTLAIGTAYSQQARTEPDPAETAPLENFSVFARTATADEVAAALQKGADPAEIDDIYNTALINAAKFNPDVKVIRLLLQSGAEVDARGMYNYTALIAGAEMTENEEIIKALLDAGAQTDLRSGPRSGSQSALHLAATANPNEKVVEVLLNAGMPVNILNREGQTPLMLAAWRNPNPKVISTLLRHGADAKLQDPQGHTAWDYANDNAALAGSEALAQLEAIIQPANKPNNPSGIPYGTQLEELLRNGSLADIQKAIDAGVDLERRNIRGIPAFCAVATNPDMKAVSLVINSGINPNLAFADGWTVLMTAAQHGNSPEIIKILTDAGADINHQDAGGWTPLTAAIFHNSDAAMIEALLKAGADPTLAAKNGQTPLDFARRIFEPENENGQKIYHLVEQAVKKKAQK